MKRIFLMLFVIAGISACTNNQNQMADYQKKIDSLEAVIHADVSAEMAAIMQADSAWDMASAANSAEGWLSFYSNDAIVMPPGDVTLSDRASVEKSIKNMFEIPGVSLRFQTSKVGVSQMGDMAYATGVYQWSSKDEKGKDYNETGKYCEVWKKQDDGTWKCIVDIWNADPAK